MGEGREPKWPRGWDPDSMEVLTAADELPACQAAALALSTSFSEPSCSQGQASPSLQQPAAACQLAAAGPSVEAHV
jgi:hypothetical protein